MSDSPARRGPLTSGLTAPPPLLRPAVLRRGAVRGLTECGARLLLEVSLLWPLTGWSWDARPNGISLAACGALAALLLLIEVSGRSHRLGLASAAAIAAAAALLGSAVRYAASIYGHAVLSGGPVAGMERLGGALTDVLSGDFPFLSHLGTILAGPGYAALVVLRVRAARPAYAAGATFALGAALTLSAALALQLSSAWVQATTLMDVLPVALSALTWDLADRLDRALGNRMEAEREGRAS